MSMYVENTTLPSTHSIQLLCMLILVIIFF